MELKKPKAILFDWDNTLVNTWPIIHSALTQTFIEMGEKPWTFEETKARVRRSMRDSFPELFGNRWEEAGKAYQKYYMENHLARLEALPGAEAILSLVKSRQVFCAVVSNKKGPNLRTEAKHIGWEMYFNALVGADDAAQDKPYVDPVMLALKDSGITPSPDVWFVGDSIVDVECAHNSGCTAIIYGDITSEKLGAPKDSLYEGFPYAHQVMDHAEFHSWLKGRL